MNNNTIHAVPRLVQIARQFCLAIDDHRTSAAVFVDIDAVKFAVMGNKKAIMDFTFTVHALTTLCFPHQFGESVFQYACPDTAEYVIATLSLQHNRVDTLEV
jgi:hypothetical protein